MNYLIGLAFLIIGVIGLVEFATNLGLRVAHQRIDFLEQRIDIIKGELDHQYELNRAIINHMEEK